MDHLKLLDIQVAAQGRLVEIYDSPTLAATRLVLDVWQKACILCARKNGVQSDVLGQAMVPERCELDLLQLKPILPDIYMLDSVDEKASDFTVRLMGTNVVNLLGRDVTGLRLQESPGSDSRIALYRQVVAEGRPIFAKIDFFVDHQSIGLEIAITPMINAKTGYPLLFCGVGFLNAAEARTVSLRGFQPCRSRRHDALGVSP